METKNFSLYVLGKFGKYTVVCYNNSKVFPPISLYIYFYNNTFNKLTIEYWIEGESKHVIKVNKSGYICSIGYKNLTKPIYIKILNKTIKINCIKEIEEEEPKEVLLFNKKVIERHGQVAILLAVFGIVSAYAIKRLTLLINPFNPLNMLIISILTFILGYYLEYVRQDSTFWLALVFTASYITSYKLLTIGKRIWFIRISPSERVIEVEEGVLYTVENKFALALQNVSEAIRRIKGDHILLKDVEIGIIGKICVDKLFKVFFNGFEIGEAFMTLGGVIKHVPKGEDRKNDREKDRKDRND